MSYTRSAWKRTYVFGDSGFYSFIGTDGNLWLFGSKCNEDMFEVIEKDDVFEFIISVLSCAKIRLDKEQMKKLAKELDVKLRNRPLTFKEMLNDMNRKSKKRKNEN